MPIGTYTQRKPAQHIAGRKQQKLPRQPAKAARTNNIRTTVFKHTCTMSDKELITRVTEMLRSKSMHPITDLHPSDVLREVMDSLEYFDALLELEWSLGVVFTDEEARDIRSFQDLLETIAKKLN